MLASRRHSIIVTAAAVTLVGVTATAAVANPHHHRGTAGSSPTPTPTSTASSGPSTSPSATSASSASSTTSTPAPTTASSTTPATTSSPSSTSPSVTATTSAAPVPTGVGGTWKLVFNDGFDTSSLDTTKWSTGWLASGITKPVDSAERDCYDPAQVSVSGGTLRLTAIQKTEACGGTTEPYASGLVNSNGKFQFGYGALEARVYLPAAPDGTIANWPAFWSDGQSWPTDGENDVMEGLGGEACYHFHSPSGGPGSCASGNYTGWHTFGADWEPGSVTYYYDGVKVGQIASGITSAPQFLILNNAVGGSGTTVTPATMQVDYVRVWQH